MIIMCLKKKNASKYDIVYLHYVNEQNLGSCTQVKFLIGSHQYSAVLDTGCEASILSEQLYNELISSGVESLDFRAFSRKAHRARKQVFLTLKFGDIHIDKIALVSEELLTPMLNGYDFCITNGIILDFQGGKLIIQNDDESTEIEIVNSLEEAREMEDCYESLSNRHFTLTTD